MDDRTPQLGRWCLQEMLNIVSAVRALHDINFRHGDLKPENILYFDNRNQLVIADVGVSRIHAEITILRHGGTKSKATTPSYEAPEVVTNENDPRSRLYDMWSLGCVFLEFTVWFLHGYDEVKNFSNARQPIDRDLPAYFYTRLPERKATVHKKVTEMVQTLQHDPRCKGNTALQSLLALIEQKLLRPCVEDRDSAEKVFQNLQDLVQKVDSKDICLFNTTDASDQPASIQGARRKSIAGRGQPKDSFIQEELTFQKDYD